MDDEGMRARNQSRLKKLPEFRVRMDVHSGPISAVTDFNDHTNVAGIEINIARRVMDYGDAGHILVSKRVAEDLNQYGHWQSQLHDLGEVEVNTACVSMFSISTPTTSATRRCRRSSDKPRARWGGGLGSRAV